MAITTTERTAESGEVEKDGLVVFRTISRPSTPAANLLRIGRRSRSALE
jgi:hypothetical protein